MIAFLWVSLYIHVYIYFFNPLFFSTEIGDFQKIVGSFIEVVDNVSKEVEKEKMKVEFFWGWIFSLKVDNNM